MKNSRIEHFFKNGFLLPDNEKFFANQYVVMESGEKRALGRYDKKQNKILPLISKGTPVWIKGKGFKTLK